MEIERKDGRRVLRLTVDPHSPWVRELVVGIIVGLILWGVAKLVFPEEVRREGIWATIHVERPARVAPDRLDARGDSRSIPGGYVLRLAVSRPDGYWWIAAALPKNHGWHLGDVSLRRVRDAPGAPVYSAGEYEIHVLMATPETFDGVPRSFIVPGDRLPRDIIDLARTRVERRFL